MATFVTFHAHPDDECIGVGGTMVKAAAGGHRVVLVTATRGELGEPVPGVLRDDEQLWERRVLETHRAAEILGAERVEFLGYEDSGMMGEPTNDNPACFWRADVEEAAQRLAAILTEVGCDVLTVYDDNGGYGHPDHIQVHRVGVRAAEIAGVTHVFEGTMNRTRMAEMLAEATESGAFDDIEDAEARSQTAGSEDFGKPEDELTHGIDVTDVLDVKRRAMEAHESQISPDSMFLAMPADAFVRAFGTEWYIERGHPRAESEPLRTDLFARLVSAPA